MNLGVPMPTKPFVTASLVSADNVSTPTFTAMSTETSPAPSEEVDDLSAYGSLSPELRRELLGCAIRELERQLADLWTMRWSLERLLACPEGVDRAALDAVLGRLADVAPLETPLDSGPRSRP